MNSDEIRELKTIKIRGITPKEISRGFKKYFNEPEKYVSELEKKYGIKPEISRCVYGFLKSGVEPTYIDENDPDFWYIEGIKDGKEVEIKKDKRTLTIKNMSDEMIEYMRNVNIYSDGVIPETISIQEKHYPEERLHGLFGC